MSYKVKYHICHWRNDLSIMTSACFFFRMGKVKKMCWAEVKHSHANTMAFIMVIKKIRPQTLAQKDAVISHFICHSSFVGGDICTVIIQTCFGMFAISTCPSQFLIVCSNVLGTSKWITCRTSGMLTPIPIAAVANTTHIVLSFNEPVSCFQISSFILSVWGAWNCAKRQFSGL